MNTPNLIDRELQNLERQARQALEQIGTSTSIADVIGRMHVPIPSILLLLRDSVPSLSGIKRAAYARAEHIVRAQLRKLAEEKDKAAFFSHYTRLMSEWQPLEECFPRLMSFIESECHQLQARFRTPIPTSKRAPGAALHP